MAALEDPFDDPGVSSVMEHRPGTRIDADPEIGPECNGRPPTDLEPDSRVTALEVTQD
jgi:hypothetical protein